MNKTKLRKIIKEELETVMSEAWFNKADAAVDDANRAAEQEYDALTAMISRLDGMESFLLNPARHKSDEPLTQQAADQLNALRATLSQLRKGLDAMGGRNPGGSIGEAHDKEWAAMSSDEQSRVDALTSIEHEADGLEKGANVMIKGHEMGRQLDNDAIGKVILNMANKIRGHVKRHREEMSMPGW